jgi:hypothetical protein
LIGFGLSGDTGTQILPHHDAERTTSLSRLSKSLALIQVCSENRAPFFFVTPHCCTGSCGPSRRRGLTVNGPPGHSYTVCATLSPPSSLTPNVSVYTLMKLLGRIHGHRVTSTAPALRRDPATELNPLYDLLNTRRKHP